MRLELLPPLSPSRPRERRDRFLGATTAIALFAATLFTTITLGGAWSLLARRDVAPGVLPLLTPANVLLVWGDPTLLAQGLAFALPTLFILLCHEAGHWLACRQHGLPTTAPIFLPAPLGLGTFGAFIHLQRPILSRRELLDVGVWGPLAGFGALLPFLFLGATLSQPSGLSESLLASGSPPRLRLGGNLLISGVLHLVHGDLPPGVVLNPHPFLLAAWVGCCATMLNLLPLGRLDGGHIVYAVSGALQRRVVWPLWTGLVILGALWRWWWLWCLMILVLGMHHPRVSDEERPLDRRRQGLALAALLLFALTFMPVPLSLEPLQPEPAESSDLGRDLERQGDRAVVDQLDCHARAEATAGDDDAARAQQLGQTIDERRRQLGWRGAFERRTAPAVERSEERELGDEQDRAAGLREVEIHLSGVVVEDPERHELVRRRRHLPLAVAALDADQHKQAAADGSDLLARDGDPGTRHPLQD